jgi:very-short-patch-repair endonuclease
LGIKVIRFTNAEVTNDIKKVLEAINNTANNFQG